MGNNIKLLENDEWVLLEQCSINDRTILCYYNSNIKQSGIIIFNLTEQPNSLSKKSVYSTWGYVTYCVFKLNTLAEAAEVYGLYLQDMEKDNFWWENLG
jgi:hypothetical protein